MKKVLVCIALVLLALASTMSANAITMKYRWFYVMNYPLTSDQNVSEVMQLMKRASAVGYNGMFFTEFKFLKLDMMDARYFNNVQKVIDEGKKLGIDVYPEVCPIGASWGLLQHDPNLAEGFPIRDAVFLVKDGKANITQNVKLANGGFEETQANKIVGWDNEGGKSSIDHQSSHSGKQSLCMNISGQSWIKQPIKLLPFHLYHLSWWNKAQGAESADINVEVHAADGRNLAWPSMDDSKHSKNWTKFEVAFNSFDNTDATIVMGIWHGQSGKLWWDDIQLEDVGLMNVLRRDGCPLVVKGEDGTIYKEGREFDYVTDPKLLATPGVYDDYHIPPSIVPLPGSPIKEGQRLLVSYYSTFPTTHHKEVTACISHPEVYALLNDEINRVNTLVHPKGFVMGHDEIRTGNWCALCQDRHMTPGQELADNVSRCTAIIKKTNPDATAFVWSDMFDPNHNAKDTPNYYLVNGTYKGSWEGLSKDVVILNWNQAVAESLNFFAKRGNSQILMGYYDDSTNTYMKRWLEQAKDTPNVVGVCYTTWEKNYKDLESFAKAAWGN